MEISSLIQSQSRQAILYDSYYIRNIESFNELIDLYRKYQKDNPRQTVIITLDDLGQAEYTSSHSTIFYDLDNTDGYDLTSIDSTCFEDGVHLGYLSTPSEFFIRKENFLKQIRCIDFEDVCKRGLTIDEDEIQIIEQINKAPLRYLDEQAILKIIPVDKSYESICGFPNGYFESDLSPFENYALAKMLYEKYNFELLGIGASLLGFTRNDKIGESRAKELVSDLSKLYNSEVAIFDNLFEIIQNNEYLFLKYVDCLAE